MKCNNEVLFQVLDKAADVVSEATQSKEFRDHCRDAMDKECINENLPVNLLNFWLVGSKRDDNQLNGKFLQHSQAILVRQLSAKKEECVKVDKQLKHTIPSWKIQLMDTKNEKKLVWDSKNETNNNGQFSQYFQGIKEQCNNNHHALFTRMGFCCRSFHKDGSFKMFIHCQPPVNNRDVQKSFLMEHKGDYDHTMWEYVTNEDAFSEAGDSKFDVSDGHYILVETAKKEDVQDQKMKNDGSPYTHMWEHQDSGENRFDRFNGQKLLGDPVATVAPLNSVIGLFKMLTVSKQKSHLPPSIFSYVVVAKIAIGSLDFWFLLLTFLTLNSFSQGKDPDVAIRVAKDNQLSDAKSAMLVFMSLLRCLQNDSNYDLSQASGRLNLYCLLVIRVFGKDTIESLLKEAAKDGWSGMEMYSIYNLILPSSIEECVFRTRLMLTSQTRVHTLAMEGQKRMVTTIWNDLNRCLEETPISSFCVVPSAKLVCHRPTPCTTGLEFQTGLLDLSKKFWSRTSIKVTSHFYCPGDGIRGFTKRLTNLAVNKSQKHAEDNRTTQAKYCNTYIADIVRAAANPFEVTNVVIVPDPEDGPDKVVREKDIMCQTSLMQRRFMEAFIQLSKTTGNNKIKRMLDPWTDNAKKYLQCFLLPKDTTKTIPHDVFAKSEKAAKPTMEELLTWVQRDKIKELEKWHYKDADKYDCTVLKCTAKLHPPKDAGLWDVTEIDSLAFALGYLLMNHKFTNKQTNGAHKFSEEWADLNYQLLHITFSKAVFSEGTAAVMTSFLMNNGVKGEIQIKKYPKGYTHEVVPHKSYITEVSMREKSQNAWSIFWLRGLGDSKKFESFSFDFLVPPPNTAAFSRTSS